MLEIDVIREELRRALLDEPWHGPGVGKAIRDVGADDAAARPAAPRTGTA